MSEYDTATMEEVAVPPQRREHQLFWWKEAIIVVAFYAVYSWTRNLFGSNKIASTGVPQQAFTNAERVIRWEQSIGMYHEQTVQSWFLSHDWFIQVWNTFYGTAHFVVTLSVFILLFIKRKDVFAGWRNTLAVMTGLAIIGFAYFPLMPPRLLDQPCPYEQTDGSVLGYGGDCIWSSLRGADGTFGFVDTLKEYGGPWSFDSEAMASISNQYAAMPSLHIGWATWCAIALWPLLTRWWTKGLVLLYPALTLFTIVVTANHYWIDGVGGLIVFAVGGAIGWGVHHWNQTRLDRKFARELAADPTGDGSGSVPPTAAVAPSDGDAGTGDDESLGRRPDVTTP